jgi:hypothetical protein
MSALTSAQLVTLKANIAANVDSTFIALRNAGSTGDMANWYNVASSFIVWSTYTAVADINDNIVWANLTPVDAPDTTQLWMNRALLCQGKQFNLQIMLGGLNVVNSSKTNIRAGLQDALTNVPSGTAGALVSAGWVPVKTVMQRAATRGEAVFATGTGTSTTPGSLVYDGMISNYDIINALNS